MTDVDRSEFVAAIREQAFQPSEDSSDFGRFPGGIVHSLLGGLGADWSVESLLATLDEAQTVEWIPAPISAHQLRVVVDRDGRLLDYRFEVKKPTADLPHVVGIRAEPPVIVDDPAPHPHGSAEEQVYRMITTRDEQGVDPWVLAEEIVKFIRKDERGQMQDFDWRSYVDRASAVAVGAGAPDDGATLPEQVEWLAARLHGPSLRPPDGPDLPLEIPDDARAPCSEAAGPLASAVRRMEADPEPFRALNPPNGWGGYNGALLFLRDLAKAAAEHPAGWIEVQW